MNRSEYESSESSTSSFLSGMVWGLAIGAVAALFFAPRRGAELRGQVADSMNRASRRAVDTYNRASETMSDVAGRADDIANTLSDRAATVTDKLNTEISDRRSAIS